MINRPISAEPEVFKLAKIYSLKVAGKKVRPTEGSLSEFFRRAAKHYLLKCEPKLKNLKNINWDESYS